MSEFFGFDIYKNWHCKFPLEQLHIDKDIMKILISEPRIDQLIKRVNVKGMRILELGCLEGMHSYILQMLGAKEIVAIEGKRENFLKSLVVKNAFKLDNCKFLFADVNKILDLFSTHFDLCLALGIFYHLKDPVKVIYRIGELADRLFVWSHYCKEDYPEGTVADIVHGDRAYHGKYIGEDNRDILSALEDMSFWMFEEDLLNAVRDVGFNNIEIIKKEMHEHGPAITFFAQK